MNMANKQVDSFQKSVGLRSASKITTECMRSFHILGLAPPPQSVNRLQHSISTGHELTVNAFFEKYSHNYMVFNLDDYTDIWEKREPEHNQVVVNGEIKVVLKTHNVNLMATCVVKPILAATPIIVLDRLNFGEIHFDCYVEFLREQSYFLSLTYNDWILLSTRINYLDIENDDAFLARLTTHHYDTAVQLSKQHRTMKLVKLIDCFPQPLIIIKKRTQKSS
eukprot:Pompholyxophrys_punicea_v1_NODE_73_length_3747_cov_4.524377.p2 type:complete len:222 gc:universal NODE_73_length_3747_cov_4.524377:1821-1156(-)